MITIGPTDQRIAANSLGALTVTVTDGDGDADATVGALTVTVADGLGAAVLTGAAATSDGEGRYHVGLTRAQTAEPRRLDAVWMASGTPVAETSHEVVGRHWFGPGALAGKTGLGAAPHAERVRVRDAFAEFADGFTGIAWVPRWWREQYTTSQSVSHLVPDWPFVRELKRLTVDGQSVLADVILEDGVIDLQGVVTAGSVIDLAYVHGKDMPTGKLVEAALLACTYALTSDNSSKSPRMISTSNEFGSVQYSYASKDRPTGLPEVDAILLNHRLKGYAVT